MKEPHKPERGHVVLDEEKRAQINEAGSPDAVDYARHEGPYLVTYWSASVRRGQGSGPRVYLELSGCVATWVRVGGREGHDMGMNNVQKL